jgi:hypothetical protein
MSIRTVVVCEAQVPFVDGGAEIHVRGLVAQLTSRGYAVERVALPFKWYPKQEILAHAPPGACSTCLRATAGR